MSFLSKQNRLAIIGRPNVGKSTLFNILTNSRKAVVRDRPGVTRDIQVETGTWNQFLFDVIDTGGVTEADDIFSVMIKEKVLGILDEVDCLLLVVDGRIGFIPEDGDLIRIAKASGKDFAIVVNKVDDVANEEIAKIDFYSYGVDVFSASFEQRRGISEALDWVTAHFTEKGERIELEGKTIAIVGKPNVGKSSLCNQLLGEHRMLVSPIAGTTVDAIDSQIEYNGEKFVIVDTAGLRKKRKAVDEIEKIANSKSLFSVRRANIVLLMIDGVEGPSVQDAKLLEKVLQSHKAVILVANKTDIGEEEIPAFRSGFREKVANIFHFYDDLPICFISAKTGFGLKKLFETIADISNKLEFRVSTSHLNKFFFETIRQAPAPVYGSKNLKFYYLTQTNQKPPSFIAFVNHPEGMTNAYRRFLIKRMKERFDLDGIPIRIFAMKTGAKKSKKAHAITDYDIEEDVLLDPVAMEEFENEAMEFDLGEEDVFFTSSEVDSENYTEI